MNLLDTMRGSLLEGFFPKGWDLKRLDECASHPPDEISKAQPHWHKDFGLEACKSVDAFNAKMGHEIASEIRQAEDSALPIALILPVGPLGMYEWVVYFLKCWGVGCAHVHCFNMDEWSDSSGSTMAPDADGSFKRAMEQAFYLPLGEATVPESQRNFATKESLPHYAEKIAALKAKGAKLILVYGIGRVFHIAFWEPHFAAEFASTEEWKAQTHRIGAKLHPLTIEQNALTSFKSRTTLVPAYANTIGPGLFLQADRAIGGCDGIMDRGMLWQGFSLWAALRYGPDPWVPASYMPTLPGRLFFLEELAGPLTPECN